MRWHGVSQPGISRDPFRASNPARLDDGHAVKYRTGSKWSVARSGLVAPNLINYEPGGGNDVIRSPVAVHRMDSAIGSHP